MRQYETVFVLDPGLSEDEVKEEVAKVQNLITGLKGEVISVDSPVRKRLAYEIKGKTEGYYTLITFRGDPASVSGIERAYRLNEKVLRHVVVVRPEKRAVNLEEDKSTREQA